MNQGIREHKALLIIGSPKGLKSTSHALGSFLMKKLDAGGLETETLIVGAALYSSHKTASMHDAVGAADLIVFSFPLYVDQLPAQLIEVLELIAGERRSQPTPRRQKIMAIVQCGFPETHQNRAACDIMQQFSVEAGFEWAGALALGMGGAIAGRSLEKAGGMVRNTIKALDLTATSLLCGGPVPREAVDLMAKPAMPKWLYLLMANWGMKSKAKKHGVGKLIYNKPYAAQPT